MERALLKPSIANHLHVLIEYMSHFRGRSVFRRQYLEPNLNLPPRATVDNDVVVDLVVHNAPVSRLKAATFRSG